MIQQEIDSLKQKLLEFTSIAEAMIEKSVQGFLHKKEDLLKEVVEKLEPQANDMDNQLDEQCLTIIAQFQPKAKNLRIVLMISKMISDLERIGDQAVNICESAGYLITHAPIKYQTDLNKLSQVTIQMLKDCVQAFINEDSALAKDICQRDSLVDELSYGLLQEMIASMSSDPASIKRALHLMRVAGNLERIADHSTNIAEDVIFMAQGQVIKHHQDEDLESEVP